MFNRRFVIGATLAGSMLFAATAFAQGQPIVGISTVTTYSADARITAVDPANRTVSLAFSNGATAVRKVSPAVANFAQAKVGDNGVDWLRGQAHLRAVGSQYQDAAAIAISVTVAAGTGTSAAGASAGQAVASWWVTAVNPAASTISLVNPAGGEVRTFNVTTPEGRAQLPRVKTGDSADGDRQPAWRSSRSRRSKVLDQGMSVRMPEGGAGFPGDRPGCDDSVPRYLTSAPRRSSVSVLPATRPLAEAVLLVQPAASGRRRLPLTVPAESTISETGRLPHVG